MGRLQLFRHAKNLFATRIAPIFENILPNSSGAAGTPFVNVVICAGLGGGMGSGTFLDMAYLIRHYLERNHPGYAVRIIGCATTAALTLSQDPALEKDTARRESIRNNTFAALKEIDYWMSWEEHKQAYTQKYYDGCEITWDHAPFDLFTLLDAINADGACIVNPFETAKTVFADMLFNLVSDETLGTTFTIDSFLSDVSSVL